MGINIACFTGARQDSVATPQAPLLHASTLLVLQVHVRIASPPLKHPCYMGINIACFTGARQDSVATPQAPLHATYRCMG